MWKFLFCCLLIPICLATKQNQDVQATISQAEWQEWTTIDLSMLKNKTETNTLDIYVVPTCFHCAKFLMSKKFDKFRTKYQKYIRIKINYIVTNASDVILLGVFYYHSQSPRELMLKLTAFIKNIQTEYEKTKGTQIAKVKKLLERHNKLTSDEFDIKFNTDNSLLVNFKNQTNKKNFNYELLIKASANKAKTISKLCNMTEIPTPFFIYNNNVYNNIKAVEKAIKIT